MFSGNHAKREESKTLRIAVRLLAMVAIVLGLSWALRTLVFQAYEIPSGSMEHTIEIGDMVFSEKVSYYFRDVQQGDIVTFADPQTPGRILIKRVVATGGQTVDLIDGKVFVDGVQLDEPYTQGKESFPLDTAPGVTITYPYTVPEGSLWVMGDNRTNSLDSRHFGAIKESSVTGRAGFTYWPILDIKSGEGLFPSISLHDTFGVLE